MLTSVNAPLAYGSPESVGLLSEPFVELQANQSSYEVAKNCGSTSGLAPRFVLITSTDSLYSYNEVHPLYPGVTVLIGHLNTIVSHFSSGKALLYADVNGTLLPEDQQIDIQDDSIYDMASSPPHFTTLLTPMEASLSKLFTTIVSLDQIGQGHFALEDKVSQYIPEYQNVSLPLDPADLPDEQIRYHCPAVDDSYCGFPA